MPVYNDRLFSPAAPVVIAKIRNPKTADVQSDVLMLIDSGADLTLLPRFSVESLGIERSGSSYELMGFDGTTSVSDTVWAELLFLGKIYRGQFLLIDQEIGILGRNILNQVCLVLDGPRLIWEERAPIKDS